jgi:hypothetical protein
MKMPTKPTNTKRNFLAIGSIAAVVGLTPVATTLAHSGFTGSDDRRESTERRSDHTWRSHSYHYKGFSQEWWHLPSLESFENRNDAKLALFDKLIDKYHLTVENGETLRAAVETDAASVSTTLTTYEQLRSELDAADTTPTDEQKAALKEATLAALSALYDYRESMHTYVAAIINAFESKWDDTNKIKHFKQQL